jgi:hypothetical protein
MKLLGILIPCAFCMCALAQSPDTPAAQERPPSSAVQASDAASVAGTVVNSLTRKPLAGVHVGLVAIGQERTPTALYGAMSDAAGRFAIAGLPPANYLILLERSGFIRVADGRKSATANSLLEVKPGVKPADLILAMAPRSIISGVVRDEYGDAAMGIQVTAIALTPQTLMDQFPRSVATDDRGYFRVALAPGKYYIKTGTGMRVSGIPEIRTDGTAESSYIETYYPGVTDKNTATLVEAKPGLEVAGLEIRLARTPVLNIGGEVMGIPEGALNMTLVLRQGSDRSYNNESRSEGRGVAEGMKLDGKFLYGHLGAGFYQIYATCTMGEQKWQSQVAEVTLTDSSIEGVNLTLALGFEVTGIVQLQGEGPAENLTVKLVSVSEAGGIGAPGISLAGNNEGTSEPTADGGFRIRNVFADHYRVQVEPLPENGYIKSVEIKGTAFAGNIVDLTGGSGASLKIIVSNNGGQISGRVESGKEPLTAMFTRVLLLPNREGVEAVVSSREWQWSEVTPDGAYSFKGLAPGKYRLLAVSALEAYSDIENVIQRARTHGEIVEIREGDKAVRSLKLAGEDENEPSK